MTKNEKERIAEVLMGLAEILEKKMSGAGMRLYIEAIADMPFDNIMVALNRLSREAKFFPKPAEIRELCGRGAVSIEDQGMTEGAKVLDAIQRIGPYKSVVFDDPITQAVIVHGFGGWEKICNETMEDQRKWFLIEFSKMYRAYHGQGVRYGGLLPGIHRLSNAARGFEYNEDPVLIGDADKAKDVLKIPADTNRYARLSFEATDKLLN